MRIVIAECAVDYSGRLDAHLPMAKRVLMFKGDGSVLIHSDGGSYKPLNWMTAPCSVRVQEPTETEAQAGVSEVWVVEAKKTDDTLVIRVGEVFLDHEDNLGIDPGLTKDGVEAHLQELLADQPELLGKGWWTVRREYPTAIGPVDILVRTDEGDPVAVEIKRRGGIDGVEQLTRYLELLSRDPLLKGITGIFAAQEITRQARTLAEDRGIRCVILDYDAMRGIDDADSRLF